jgi:hypothetical protein
MATKKTEITKDKIVSMYMNYRLENSHRPKSVYQFAKDNGFDESLFYSFFGTLERVEKEVYKLFIDKTVELIKKDPSYENYDMKSKLLSFYFTLFELMSANRSYVLLTLKEHQSQTKNLMQISSLKVEFKNYVAEIITDDVRTQFDRFINIQEKAIKESAWLQFVIILKFWIDDESPAFEKTDIFIEKSLKASFELINVTPIESLIDFGKFLYKEKIQKN